MTSTAFSRTEERRNAWETMNRSLVVLGNPRLAVILHRLYISREALPSRMIWTQSDDGRYCLMPDDDGHPRFTRPNSLVLDKGSAGIEGWNTVPFWLEATKALGMPRTDQHLNELVYQRETHWCNNHRQYVVYAVQLEAGAAKCANRVEIPTGDRPGGGNVVARAGDFLVSPGWESGGVPYNEARIYSRKAFTARARYLGKLT